MQEETSDSESYGSTSRLGQMAITIKPFKRLRILRRQPLGTFLSHCRTYGKHVTKLESDVKSWLACA